MRIRNKGVWVAVSVTRKRNGRSRLIWVLFFADTPKMAPVDAAAVVPFSSTEMSTFCTTRLTVAEEPNPP